MNKLIPVLFALWLQGCAQKPVSFEPVSVAEVLPHLQNEGTELFKSKMLQNCHRILQKEKFDDKGIFGRADQWQQLCSKAQSLEDIPTFINNHFNVLKVQSKDSLFTGYYAPFFEGSRTQTAEYNHPLLAKPTDIYTLNLTDLGLEGEQPSKFMVRVDSKSKTIQRYYTRKDIHNAAAEPLVWLKSKVDAFFVSIQGSAFIKLPDGDVFHVAYAGNNGHAYRAIGRDLIQQGYIAKDKLTMATIYEFFDKNPDKVDEFLNKNKRYIFFAEGDGQVRGSLNVPLHANRSLAVDPKYIPLGVPVFLKTNLNYNQQSFKSWMFAEDTGAAIKGGLRGDIYFGQGFQAGQFAGAQNASGSMYVFVPK